MLIFPFELWARELMNYHTILMLSVFMNLSIALAVSIAVYGGLRLARRWYILRKSEEQLVEERGTSVITDNSSQEPQPSAQLQVINLQSCVFDLGSTLMLMILWIIVACFYLAVFAIGWLGRGIMIDISTVVVMVALVIIPNLFALLSDSKIPSNIQDLPLEPKPIATMHRIKQVIVLIGSTAWLVIAVLSVIKLKGVCLCGYNDNYGTQIDQGYLFSTEKSRLQQINQICPANQLCHLYATLPEESDRFVFINVHTGLNLSVVEISLRNKRNQQLHSFRSQEPIRLENVQYILQRNVHTVLFKSLSPATTYELKVLNPLTNQVLRVTNYRTLPNKDAKQLRMAVGGDIAMTINGSKITQHLKSYDPDVILIGGDITYDDAMRTCGYSWDNFYWIFQELDLAFNRTIPMILGIGNHDVGHDSLASATTDRLDQYQIPLFFLYNPQHFDSQSEQVPHFSDRSGIHYHILANTVHLFLDSGYILQHEEQVDYIKDISQKHASYYRFANYHNPIFPTCYQLYPDSNDNKIIMKGFKHWTPLFDEFNFTTVMEHHTHHRKMTKKIRNRNLDDTGVRYVGDGSWGVPEPPCTKDRTTHDIAYFDDLEINDPNHVWKITILNIAGNFVINYTSVDLANQVVFQVVQSLPKL